MPYLKIDYVDEGFCRIVFKVKVKNRWVRYCLQQDWREDQVDSIKEAVVCYYFDGEPSHPVDPDKMLFEFPTGDSKIEDMVRRWIMNEEEAVNE